MTAEIRTLNAGAIPLSFRLKAALGYAPTARGEPIPPAERKLGFDLSKWNGGLNHETAFLAGIQFALYRATMGASYVDDQYNNNRNNTRYPWGSYHAVLASSAGSVQANHFCDVMGDNPGPILPVWDVEWPMPASLVKSACLQMYTRIHTYGMIYTSAYKWSQVTGETDKAWISAHCPLFVAHWGTLSPLLPTGWTTYAVHQYSADGNGKGQQYGAPPPPAADADMDLNYCCQSWLDQYAPQPTLEQRVTALEDWVEAHG